MASVPSEPVPGNNATPQELSGTKLLFSKTLEHRGSFREALRVLTGFVVILTQGARDVIKCEEIHVFQGLAERTGNTTAFRSARNYPACSSFRDLVRKYNLHGDGVFYLRTGSWPWADRSVALDNVKWIGSEAALRQTTR